MIEIYKTIIMNATLCVVDVKHSHLALFVIPVVLCSLVYIIIIQ